MIVGTAGHIDHGKTSLVKALTSVDCDRLAEEKARGITIELGFAYLPRPAGTIGFVDVPGHEKLVHTMLAGATGIDLVLLVVAADDGPMPQTREHLAILDLLGLSRGLVALTKADLVGPDRLAEATAEVEALLEGTGLAGSPVLPVSAVTGAGLPQLLAALDAAAAETANRPAEGRFRLGVDRVFTLKGAGTLVTGTIHSGRVRVGDRLRIAPDGPEARVRSLHAQGAPSEEARAGERCAVALAGISTEEVHRGAMLLDPAVATATRRFDAAVRLLPAERRALGHWAPVRIHHAAAEVTARLVMLDAETLAPGVETLVQIVPDAPLAVAVGDRFVLRDVSATRTIGGGRILDRFAPERRRRAPERLAELAAVRDLPATDALRAVLSGARGWADLDAWFRDRAAAPEAAAEAVRALDLVEIAAGEVRAAFLPDGWAAFAADLGARLDRQHEEHPDQPGLGQERLRLALRPRLPAPVFAAAIQRLAADGELVLDRSWLRRPWHEVRLAPQEEEIWTRLRPALSGEERFRPPRVRDLARATGIDEAFLRRLLRHVARRGDLEEIAQDHFFLAETVVEMADLARELADAGNAGQFPVVAFRDRLDNGRKVAIQILEFFDRQGLTMRRGDLRRINPHRRDLYSGGRSSAPGGESSPVGRPDFKSGRGRETVPGGFDSRLLRQHPQEARS